MFAKYDTPPPLHEYTPFMLASVDSWAGFNHFVQETIENQPTTTDNIPKESFNGNYRDLREIFWYLARLSNIYPDTDTTDEGSICRFYRDELDGVKNKLIGYHSDVEYPGLYDDELLNMVLTSGDLKKLVPEGRDYLSMIKILLSNLIIHDIPYGYIATPERLRFIKLSLPDTPEVDKRLKLQVSPPVPPQNWYSTCKGIVSLLSFGPGSPKLNNVYGVYVKPLKAHQPHIFGTSLQVSGQKSTVEPICWNAFAPRGESYKVFFHHGQPSGVLRTTIMEEGDREPNNQYRDMVFHYALKADIDGAEGLMNEAEMYEYLISRKSPYVPNRYLYGILMDSMYLLCFEPFGVDVTSVQLPRAIPGIRKAVNNLHQMGVLLGYIELEYFSVDEMGKVIVNNLSGARMHRRLTPEMMREEMDVIDYLLAEAMRH